LGPLALSTKHVKLEDLAKILADWADPPPGVDHVYLLGSRVRGDQGPDSDVDVRVYPEDWRDPTVEWWQRQNATDFADLRERLRGVPLHLGRDKMDWANVVDQQIMSARSAPVLVRGKVSCLLIPPKPTRSF
jgi:predicted nucleotidyltransferase